ncbi:copper amine oxidase N-terminal domain-containing protein [Ezakiella coagulans]|uniref:copper amine oxidase N-terminal domain-containing protein n=1 Tax=Ezakiella coagulans TaxID=46507 RepID=UPI002014B936|nr:copper amine oxidase N-terminal domain-containing protein [Ezakiella coagulans]UQK60562.1 copper amine oxidase N-terminal domain-containing protein [Ezakiella coagulans]
MTNKKKNTKITKKTAIGLLVLGQMMTTGALAAPKEAISAFKDVKEIRQDIGHFKGEIKLFIEKDGKKTRVDQNMKDGLRVVEGRTCVGVRDLVNAIEGAEVEWDQANKIVDIRYGGKEISYPLNKPVMWNGNKMVTIDVPAQVDPSISRTFLPIRNIAETLGFKVDWNQKTKEVTLTPGAGTAPTTTQQPKANTSTNTKNLSWVTASGQKIPKRNELPAEPGNWYEIKIKREDVIYNKDGTNTYFKGTPLEFTTQPKFKYVKKSPEWGGFNLFGPSGNDPRVGLAAFQEGHPVYDKWKADRIAKYPDEFDPAPATFFMPMHKIIEEYPNREIPYDIVKQIPNRLKMDKNNEDIIYFIDDINMKLGKWYDFTGIMDKHITGAGNIKKNTYNLFLNADFVITTDGYLISCGNLLNYKDKVIDKVIDTTQIYNFVVDIPDIRIGDYIEKIKYDEGTYGIFSHKVVRLHK